jgi:hypothetical protein
MVYATAICPDGKTRPVTYNADGVATVKTPGGSRVTGTITDGRFRPDANHHGAHKMWQAPPVVPEPTIEDRSVSVEDIERINRRIEMMESI